MTFKDLLASDADIFMNEAEFAENVFIGGDIVQGLFTEQNEIPFDVEIYKLQISTASVSQIAINDVIHIRGEDYMITDFEELEGVTEILLNKVGVGYGMQ